MPSDHAEVSLTNVRVPASTMLGEEGRGLDVAQTFVHENRIPPGGVEPRRGAILHRHVGGLRQNRKVFGKALASNQAIQFPLAELHTEAEMTRGLVRKTAWKSRSPAPHAGEASVWRCRTTAPTAWSARRPTAPSRSMAASAIRATRRSSTSTAPPALPHHRRLGGDPYPPRRRRAVRLLGRAEGLDGAGAMNDRGKQPSNVLSARVIRGGGEEGAPREAWVGEVGHCRFLPRASFELTTTSPSHCFAMGPSLSPATRRRGLKNDA